jgi:hypothetical protein
MITWRPSTRHGRTTVFGSAGVATRHPRVQLPVIRPRPTGSTGSAFFSIITRPALRRGSFPTVADLIAAIERFIDAWNDLCRPFSWTKDPDTLLAKATDPRRRKTPITLDTDH